MKVFGVSEIFPKDLTNLGKNKADLSYDL